MGNEPTYISGKNQSTIDITLVSAEYSHLIRNWTVSNDHNHSDHRTITFEIESLQPETTYRLNTKKMNMEGFKKDVEEDIKKLQIPNKWDLDTMTIGQKYLTTSVTTSIYSRGEMERVVEHRKPNKWRTQDIIKKDN